MATVYDTHAVADFNSSFPLSSTADWLFQTVTSSSTNWTTQSRSRAPSAPPSEHCLLYWFIMYTVLTSALCILGFLGNAVSFAVFWVDRQKTSTSFLFQCLCVVDNLLLVTVFPLYVLPYFSLYTGMLQTFMKQAFAYVPVYVLPCTFIVQTATIWLTVLVGVNRYVAVCHPYQATRLCSIAQARKQVLVVLLCSVIYCIPKFFVGYIIKSPLLPPPPSASPASSASIASFPAADAEYFDAVAATASYINDADSQDYVTTIASLITSSSQLKTVYKGPMQVKTGKTWLGENFYFNIIYNNALYLIFLLGLPLILLTLLNARLVRSLHELKKKRAKMQVSEKQRQESNVTFVLIVVVLVFCVCQAPALVNQIFWNVLSNDARACGGFQFYFSPISNVLVILNSSVNFVIYLLCNTRFQQTLAERFCCCLPPCCRGQASRHLRPSSSAAEPRYLALSTAPPRGDTNTIVNPRTRGVDSVFV